MIAEGLYILHGSGEAWHEHTAGWRDMAWHGVMWSHRGYRGPEEGGGMAWGDARLVGHQVVLYTWQLDIIRVV